jgi:DNA-binding response OmpR family regulator
LIRADIPLLLVDPYKNLLHAYHILFEEEGLSVQTAASLEEARSNLKRRSYAIILAELLMPEADSLVFWKEIKSRHPETYLILLTDALVDEEGYERLFNAGVDDLFIKPFPPKKLLVHVRRGLRQRALILQQRKQDKLALMDPISLTLEQVILGTDYFKRCFRQELKRAKRHQDPLSLILVKTSKPENELEDQEEFLLEVAKLLRSVTREEDIIGRENGGFGILLYKTDQQGSKLLIARLSHLIQDHLPLRKEIYRSLLSGLKFDPFTIPDNSRIPKPFSGILRDINREISVH